MSAKTDPGGPGEAHLAHVGPSRTPRRGCDTRHYIGDLIYGANDGLITAFAVVAAVSGGALSTRTVLIVGMANLVANGLSMGVGNYLSIRSHESALTAEGRPEEEAYPAGHGAATFVAFVLAGAVPLLPYAAGAGMSAGLLFSVVLTSPRCSWSVRCAR